MLKKIASFSLAIILIISSISAIAFASETETVVSKDVQGILESLGIVMPKNELVYSQPVTRGDFAVYTARMLGFDDTKIDTNRYFLDVASYDYALSSINYLAEKGVVSIPSDSNFRTDDFISFNEAYKMMVCSLSWTPYANALGGYPTGYRAVAKKLELDEGISANPIEYVTLNDAILLLYNTMLAPIYTIDGVKKEVDDFLYTFSENPEDTLINRQYGIAVREGVLTGYDGMNISLNATARTDEIAVDGMIIDAEGFYELKDYIGSYIKVFYDEKNEYLKYYVESKKKSDIIEIGIEDFSTFDGREITWWNNGNRLETENISEALLLFNGVIPSDNIRELFDELENGTIKIIDYDRNGINDAVIVNNYTTFVYKYSDVESNVLFSKIKGQSGIELNKYDRVLVKTVNDEITDVSILEPDNVLSIASAEDYSRIEIIVSDKKISGSVSGYSKGKEPTVTVGETAYPISKKYKDDVFAEMEVGGCTFLINSFEEIVMCISGTDDGYTAAVLLGIAEEEGLDSAVMFRIYTKEKGITTLKASPSLKIDGAKKTTLSEIVIAIPETTEEYVTTQIIRYKADDNGVVKAIDTYNLNENFETEETSLKRYTDGKQKLIKYNGRLGKKYVFSSATDFFCIPQTLDGAEETDFAVTNQGSFNPTVAFGFECYSARGENEYLDYVLYRLNLNDTAENDWANSSPMIVKEVLSAVDGDDEVYKQISVIQNGASITVDIYEDKIQDQNVMVDELEIGDLIRVRKSVKGYVICLEQLYDAKEDKCINWSADTETNKMFVSDINANFQLSYGFVVKKGETTLSWGHTSPMNIDERATLSNTPVVVYNPDMKDGQQVYMAKFDSIRDYESAGAECDKIIVYTMQNYPRMIFVYR